MPMESPFAITVPTNSVRLEGSCGETSITVTNNTPRAMKARAEVVTSKPESKPWLSISGKPERFFSPGAVEQFVVQVNIPAGCPEGDHTFQLRVADVANPNESLTIGPAVGFKITGVPKPPPPPPPRWIFLVIAVVLLLVVGGIVFWALRRTPAPIAEIEVPDITNKTIADARTILEGQGLTLGEINRRVEAKPKDIVLQQTPAAHQKAGKGNAVAVVASHESMLLVPPLNGKSEAQARALLAGLLDVERVEKSCRPGSDAADTVYESNPNQGLSVSRTTKVLLRLKDNCVTLPRLIGADKASAFTQLNALGLLGNPVAGSVDANRVDTVEDQNPPPNTLVAKGGTVTLSFYHRGEFILREYNTFINRQIQTVRPVR